MVRFITSSYLYYKEMVGWLASFQVQKMKTYLAPSNEVDFSKMLLLGECSNGGDGMISQLVA